MRKCTVRSPQKYTPLEYRLLQVIGEGSFSIVYKAQNLKNSKVFAVKCLKHHFDSVEQVDHFIFLIHAQVQNLREIQALMRLSPHPHVIKVFEVLL